MAYPKTPSHPPTYTEATTTSPNKPTNTHPKHAMLSITSNDRIRLLRFPDATITTISETLPTLWPKGIQNTRSHHETTEFKLRGNPFTHGPDEEKLAVRKLLLGLLDRFARTGWGVHAGLGRIGNYASVGEKDSVVFVRQTPRVLSWLCVSFDAADLMHVIGAPGELGGAFLEVFGDRIISCNRDLVSGSFEVRFRGGVWSKSGGAGPVLSRLVVLDVLRCLEDLGYMLCVSLDVDSGVGGDFYRSSGETWFCCR
ncbi:hypothetical protein BDV28DRAFT_138955 [Aspergillus coremiiformis]|uniref:Uncharacterized protein n=1 Tax=Aspergillus coremiiformis TaxID=138285 RepID=A0A5N6YYK8_9EURO|nr:hypothetical protein BDV28DRAFT_138955 [Aspergillus coremiiformis]